MSDQALVAENQRLKQLLNEKEEELLALQANLNKAITSIKTFHEQQKQLYGEFVTLHGKYAAQKSRNRSTLWSFVPANCTGFDMLPLMSKDVSEGENFVDTYKLGDLVGHGQFADVRRAQDLLTSNGDEGEAEFDKAVKIIDKNKINDVISLKRVVAELAALKALNHPNILPLLDVIHSEDYLYIVTQCGGKDLFEYFEAHPKGVTEDVAKGIINQIVSGIAHVHAHDFCHRDLKPENVLYDAETGAIHVIDFGLCADLSKVPWVVRCCRFVLVMLLNLSCQLLLLCFLCFLVQTPTHTRLPVQSKMLTDFCGSPGFFAPEIILSKEYNGQCADYWSIGCILLELLVGNAEFEQWWIPVRDYVHLVTSSKNIHSHALTFVVV